MRHYLSLVKFSHTIFALPFAIIGFFLAIGLHQYPFFWNTLLLVLACMVTARNAAMGFNRWADRYLDSKNPRTAIREIPAGVIAPARVLFFVMVNCFLFIFSTWLINPLCFYLSPVALLIVLGYSYTKRFTPLCHFILGLGLALAPLGAYLAVSGKFHLLPVLFSCIVLCWVSGFDIIYALQDESFDKKEGLYSIPSWMGTAKALCFSRILHLFAAIWVVVAGIYGHMGYLYWIGAFVFGGLLVYQHSLVKPDDLSRVNLAFATTNGIASVLFSIFVIGDLFI